MFNSRIAIWLPLSALLMAGFSHAGTILYEVATVGQLPVQGGSTVPLFRYTYQASGMTFLANQELDIVFSAQLYGEISDGVADPGFDLLLLQPNNPPGAPGHFSALALTNIGVGQGTWSVDFTFTGPGQPGSQQFYINKYDAINQYDANGTFITTLDSGFTQNLADVPEPGTFMLLGLVLIGCGVGWAVRRRNAATAPRGSRTS